ncbi:MAG: ABC transporter permease [Planctomycetota bacterium]|nr:ABC transporter permease [Planctomycetota bacterium]
MKALPLVVFLLHFVLHILLGVAGWLEVFELFNLMLLVANFVIFILIGRGKVPLLEGIGVMTVVVSHATVGQKIAPDSLTSGTILMVNILVLYVGFKVFKELSLFHCVAFVGSYFLLFLLFIVLMRNAEALFLLSLLGLVAVVRSFRLLAYFWCIVVSFSFCQPYAWEAVLFSFLALKILFSARDRVSSPVALVFLGCGLVFLFFVLLPVAVLVLGESPHSMMNILKDSRIRSAIYLTSMTATISTLILAVFCIPLGYAIARQEFFGKSLLLSLIDIPVVIPQSVAGIALVKLFGRQQFLGEALYSILGVQFENTVLGIILAQVFVAMPFIMKTSIAAFEAVPERLEMAARVLGASSFESFRRVALPLAARGLFLGCVIAWARAAGEFGAIFFIAPYPETAPVAAYNRFSSVGLVETTPLVATLLLYSLAMFFLLQVTSRLIRSLRQRGER